jgi:hypothetical protein
VAVGNDGTIEWTTDGNLVPLTLRCLGCLRINAVCDVERRQLDTNVSVDNKVRRIRLPDLTDREVRNCVAEFLDPPTFVHLLFCLYHII